MLDECGLAAAGRAYEDDVAYVVRSINIGSRPAASGGAGGSVRPGVTQHPG
ncbi:hypothetical protein BH18ACT8_BH18ACT8_14530 [soil metagenome]